MIRVLKLSKRIVVRWAVYPHIVDADFFVRLQIVVNDHSPRTNNGHIADFSRFKPATLDRGESVMGKEQGHVSDVLDLGSNMRVSLAVNGNGELAEDMQNDRNIMRRQVPRHIDVLLEQTQIEPS